MRDAGPVINPSFPVFIRVIRKLCFDLQQQVQTKAGKKASQQAVIQLLFLRFFCPAIASPEAFALVDQPPSKKAHRALVLISYCLKHLASGTVFKDLHMTDINSFIRDHTDLLKDFIAKISVLHSCSGRLLGVLTGSLLL